jgi:hypothetical protein
MSMRAHATLVLLICKTGRRLGLRIAIVLSCHRRLAWWGIAVVSSRRPRSVRIGLLPLIHGDSGDWKESREILWVASQVGLWSAKLGSTKKRRTVD